MDNLICFHPYTSEMDQLVEANHQWVEEDFTTCIDAKMMKSDQEEESKMLEPWNPKENMANEEEENVELGTPRTKIGSNEVVNNTFSEIGST